MGLDHVTIVRNVPIFEVSFYKVLPEIDLSKEYGFPPVIPLEIFERVKINVCKINFFI